MRNGRGEADLRAQRRDHAAVKYGSVSLITILSSTRRRWPARHRSDHTNRGKARDLVTLLNNT